MPLWRTKSHHSQASSEADATSLARSTSASKNDAAVSASQAASTAWLAGHLNHLTPEQEEKLRQFKVVCAERGYYSPADVEDGIEGEVSTEDEEQNKRKKEGASHDDATMLYVRPQL